MLILLVCLFIFLGRSLVMMLFLLMLFMLVFLFVFTPVIIVNVWLNSQFLRNDAQVHDTLFGYLDLVRKYTNLL